MGSIDDFVAAIQEMLSDEQLNQSPCGAIVSVFTTAGDDKGHCDLGDMPGGPSDMCEQRPKVLDTIQVLVRRVRLPVPDNNFDVLRLAREGLHDQPALIG